MSSYKVNQKNAPIVLAIFVLMYALSAGVPSAMAQENASLGEDLAGGSYLIFQTAATMRKKATMLMPIAQDSTNTAAVNPNQEQTVDEDNFAEFGDDTADHDAANVAVPIAVPINVDEEEEEEVPPECPAGFTLKY